MLIILGDLSVVCWAEVVLNWRRSTGDLVFLFAHAEAWGACNNGGTGLCTEVLFWKYKFTSRWGEADWSLPHAHSLSLCLSLVIFLFACRLIKFQLSLDPEEIQDPTELWACFSGGGVNQTLEPPESVFLHLTQASLRSGPRNLTGVANECRFGHSDGLGNHQLAHSGLAPVSCLLMEVKDCGSSMVFSCSVQVFSLSKLCLLLSHLRYSTL